MTSSMCVCVTVILPVTWAGLKYSCRKYDNTLIAMAQVASATKVTENTALQREMAECIFFELFFVSFFFSSSFFFDEPDEILEIVFFLNRVLNKLLENRKKEKEKESEIEPSFFFVGNHNFFL